MAQNQSDEELMSSYQQGNFDAFEILYGRYSGKVYGFLRKRLAPALVDDIHQAIFMKLHESRSKYKKQFKFAPWLFVIARTSMIDHLRKIKNKGAEIDIENVELAAEQGQVNSIDVAQLEGLSDIQKRVVELRYGQDQEFVEIAKRLNLSEQNVRQQVSRALRKLRRVLRGAK